MRGFKELVAAAQLPAASAAALHEDLADLGAVDVRELTGSDWESLAAWSALRPLQRRRLLQCLGGPSLQQ